MWLFQPIREFSVCVFLSTFVPMNLKVGIFVGSFNPFTIGHDSIVRRVLPLFDKLVIGVVGDHVSKPGLRPAEERVQTIRQLYEGDERI